MLSSQSSTLGHLHGRLLILADDVEGEELGIGLYGLVVEPAADQPLDVEDGVLGIHGGLVLGGIADETLSVGGVPCNVRRPAGDVGDIDRDTELLPRLSI